MLLKREERSLAMMGILSRDKEDLIVDFVIWGLILLLVLPMFLAAIAEALKYLETRSLAMKYLLLGFLFLGVLQNIAHSVLRNKEALEIVDLVIALLVLLIFLAAIAKAYSTLKTLLFQALGFFLKEPSKGSPSSIIEGPSFAGPSLSGSEMHTLTSTTEPCEKPHQSSSELCTEAFEGPFSASSFEPSEGPPFFEPSKAPSSLIKLLPCKEALESPCFLFPIEHSSCSEASQDPNGFEPCKGSSSDGPYHEAFEGPSSSLYMDNEGCPSSSNNRCQSWKGHSSKGPSSHSNSKPRHEALAGPSQSNTKPEEGASFKGPCSSSSKPSRPENSKPSKGPSSLIKPLHRNEASERSFSPHSSEHSSCNEASTDPPTILKPCKGPPSHSHTKPCHEAFQSPSLNMDNEASKGFPSPSNNSCEPYKAHSSNNSCESHKRHPSDSNTKPCHGAFEGPSLSMDKEASKGCPSSSNIWTDCLTDREVYKSAVNDTGIANSIIKQKKKTDAYSDLLKAGSALFSNMLWKVHFSNDFKNSFPQIKLVEKKAKIVNRICRISSGHHCSKYKMGCVSPTDKLHGLIEVDIVADLCLVWNVDIERDVEAVQIIKIWDIVDRQILPKLIQRLQGAFHVYSERYIERCKIRRQSRDKELAVPERWVEDPDFVWFKAHERSTQVAGSQDQSSQSDSAYLENSNISESLLLMKFYAMSSGIAKNLLTAKDGSEVNLPFQVNTEESIIIRHRSSCFILGRSGTGKTTVLVTKLVQKEQQNEISISGLNLSEAPPEAIKESSIAKKERIKQIFVTLSPLLCSDIKQQITKIQRTLSAAAGTTTAQNYSISEYELLLDGDIESKLMGTLPDTFIDVPSKHYPMVSTFRKFLMMLANSVPCPFFKDKAKSLYQRKEIDYDRFDSVYWPHLNASLTKKFDSSTVFTEIMSVIKGSVQAVKSEKGVLSKELYCSLNSSTKELSGPQKEDIYKLFVQYEKLKMEANCYDMADWVKYTYKQLCCGEYCGEKIDFVYIDEVQDFTQAQLSLFSFVCTNMKEGYIFAGDTAQTITQGVHFRFQDGQSLFYTDFKESANTRVSDIAASANTCNNKEFKPKLFQLRHNFRTHMGVVKMANSIVQLLYHFFPQSIDKMAPETSLVWGHLPALLKGRHEDLVKAWNNMGAQQVIIVRDEAQKAQLLEKIGKSGLVLTISGCKGLEFQDVLLYNFFSGSVMQNKWRVLYEYPFQTNFMKTTGNSEKKTHPTFDVNKHQLVCSELKHLYVAVTRAQQRLWIFEDNDDFCKPMLDYWLGHELIEIKSLDQSFVFSIKSSSIPDNWRKTGLKLFNRQHYDDAMLCFEQAGDEQYVELAKAASLKQKGEKQLSTSRREAINKLREAAELFLVLKKTEIAAECFIAIGDLKKAGVLYIENCTPPKFEDAGDCFLEAKSWLEAGEAYFGGGCIKKCLDACFKGKNFENGLSFIKKWRKEHLNDSFQGKRVGYNEEIDEYLQKCAASFHQQNSIVTMMMFVNAFSSIDLKRVFLRGRNCFHELMIMEEAEENYLHAAELAEAKGDLLHAAMLLEKAGDYDNAVKKVLLLILEDALWGEKNKGWPFRTMKRPEELLQMVEFLAELAENSVRHEAQLEVQLIFEEPRNLQEVRYLIAQAQTISSTRAKFFTTWKALDAFLRILKEQKLGPEDRNAMLVQTLSLWIDWQDIVLSCKKAVLGQDHLQKAIPVVFGCWRMWRSPGDAIWSAVRFHDMRTKDGTPSQTLLRRQW